jgi:ATP synthase subunit 6
MFFSVFEQFQFHIGLYDISMFFFFFYNQLSSYYLLNLNQAWCVYYIYFMWLYSVVIDPINRLGYCGANEGVEALMHIFWYEITKYVYVVCDCSLDWVELQLYYLFKIDAISRFFTDFVKPVNYLLMEEDKFATFPFPFFFSTYNISATQFFYLYVPFFTLDDLYEYLPLVSLINDMSFVFLLFIVWVISNWGSFIFFFLFFLVCLFFFKPFVFLEHRRFLLSFFFILIKKVYVFFYDLVYSYLKEDTRFFFPFIFFIFLFISIVNLTGMIPYSFALTSHLIMTFSLSVISWGGFVLYGFERHGFKLFSIFYPKGLSFYLVPFICLIELVSHLTRLISLSLRLFSNIVAGHILLDLISVFLFKMSMVNVFSFKLLLLPVGFGIIFVLFFFELAICLLQGYIFAVLSCIYCKDYLYLSH